MASNVLLTAACAIEEKWRRPQACKSRWHCLRPDAGRRSGVLIGSSPITQPHADPDPVSEPYADPQSVADADTDINQFRPVGWRDRDQSRQ